MHHHSAATNISPVGLGIGLIGLAGNIALYLIQEFWVKVPHWLLYVGGAIATGLLVAGVVLVIRGLLKPATRGGDSGMTQEDSGSGRKVHQEHSGSGDNVYIENIEVHATPEAQVSVEPTDEQGVFRVNVGNPQFLPGLRAVAIGKSIQHVRFDGDPTQFVTRISQIGDMPYANEKGEVIGKGATLHQPIGRIYLVRVTAGPEGISHFFVDDQV